MKDSIHRYRISVKYVLLEAEKATAFSGVSYGSDSKVLRIIVLDNLNGVLPGEVYDVAGTWEVHPKYGPQLRCYPGSARRVLPEGRFIIPFLAERLPGIGTERAKKLSKIGDDLDLVLSDPSRLFEIAEAINPNLSSYSMVIASSIQGMWSRLKHEYEALTWLEVRGVSDRRVARKIVSLLGERTISTIIVNPYVMVGCIGWKPLDQMARQIMLGRDLYGEIVNMSPKETLACAERLVGAVDSVFLDAVSDGHTAVLKSQMPGRLAAKLGTQAKGLIVDQAIHFALDNNAIVDGGNVWRSPGCAWMEDDLTRKLAFMQSCDSAVSMPAELGEHIKAILSAAEICLYDEQMEAVETVLTRPVAVLTGGAGTGKTTTTRAICQAWESLGGQVIIAAVAGKAALRSAQATGRKAFTVFRLLRQLDQRRALSEFQANLELALEGDGSIRQEDAGATAKLDARTLLIIDEASMVDLGQWHRLVERMPKGCRLLMVGDPGQLPPVGFGVVFHRLAENHELAVSLKQVRRQAGDSGIPSVSADLRAGRMPQFRRYSGLGEGISVLEMPESEEESTKLITNIVRELGGFSPHHHELMIIAATNHAVNEINATFSGLGREKYSDPSENRHVKGYLGEYFAVGDPVIFVRNDYERDLRNGNLGHVVEADPDSRRLTASFDGRMFDFDTTNLIDLKLAYALTCHRSQGSEVDRVIVLLSQSAMCDRSWLYTAVTRTRKQCVILAQKRALQETLMRAPSWESRVVSFSGDINAVGRTVEIQESQHVEAI